MYYRNIMTSLFQCDIYIHSFWESHFFECNKDNREKCIQIGYIVTEDVHLIYSEHSCDGCSLILAVPLPVAQFYIQIPEGFPEPSHQSKSIGKCRLLQPSLFHYTFGHVQHTLHMHCSIEEELTEHADILVSESIQNTGLCLNY